MQGKTDDKCSNHADAGLYFKKITERLRAIADRNGVENDITYVQGKVIFYLHGCENGQAEMRDIENYLDVSHATVSGIVSRLEEKGRVISERSQQDARAKTVRLTSKEMSSFAEMAKRRAQMEELLLKGFSAADKNQLFSYLEKIYGNLKEAEESGEI